MTKNEEKHDGPEGIVLTDGVVSFALPDLVYEAFKLREENQELRTLNTHLHAELERWRKISAACKEILILAKKVERLWSEIEPEG